MKTKRTPPAFLAAAIAASVFAASAAGAAADETAKSYGSAEVTAYGGTLLTFTSADSITQGSGKYKDDHIDSFQYSSGGTCGELTLPAISSSTGYSAGTAANYNRVDIEMATNDANPVSISVRVGNTEVVSTQAVQTFDGSWNPYTVTFDLNAAYSGADLAQNVTLYITKAAKSDNSYGTYLGNYYNVEFYNADAKAEAVAAAAAKPVTSVVKAAEFTRTAHSTNFGTLSSNSITDTDAYGSVFGDITSYTQCSDFTDGNDYYYANVTEAGEYSFAVLAEGNGGTKITAEKVAGTNTEVFNEALTFTQAGTCSYKGSNSTEENRNLYVAQTSAHFLEKGYYKIIVSPNGGIYYCDLIAAAGIRASASANITAAAWSYTGSDSAYSVDSSASNKLTAANGETVYGYKTEFTSGGAVKKVKVTVCKSGTNEIQSQERELGTAINANEAGIVFYILSSAELDAEKSTVTVE